MLDFKTMDDQTLAASLATYNRWRKGEGEFADFKKQHPYKPSELTALMNEIVRRLPLIEAKDAELTAKVFECLELSDALNQAKAKLDAKDAEIARYVGFAQKDLELRINDAEQIATLKAVIEEAAQDGNANCFMREKIEKTLAAINEATGEK